MPFDRPINAVDRIIGGLLPNRVARLVRRLRPGSEGSDSSLRLLVNGQGRRDSSGLQLPALRYSAPDPAAPSGIVICERLVAAYHLALQNEGPRKSSEDIWDLHAREYHHELRQALLSRDAPAARNVLGRMFIDPVTTGLALGRQSYEACLAQPRAAQLDWHDKTISLGLSVGVIPAQCPEQGEYGTLLDLDSPSILKAVADQLKVSLAPPQAGAIFGVESMGSIYPVNYLLQICTADRIRSLIAGGAGSSTCLEIGGGVGFLAVRSTCAGDSAVLNHRPSDRQRLARILPPQLTLC